MSTIAALILASAVSSSTLSLKDGPVHLPDPSPFRQTAYYLKIEGIQGQFEVPAGVLRKYRLRNGETISLVKARLIAAELGYDYSPQTRVILQELDEKEGRE